MHADYQARCADRTVRIGRPYLWLDGTRKVLNFPTKHHWRDRSNRDDVLAGLDFLVEHAHSWPIGSLAVPALGCGRGGLRWDDIKQDLVSRLTQLPSPVELFIPRSR